jgi:hypothetical protein
MTSPNSHDTAIPAPAESAVPTAPAEPAAPAELAAPSHAVAPTVGVAGSTGSAVAVAPPAVDEYNALSRQMRHIRQRLNALRPALAAFVTTLPTQSLNVGDGKLRMATTSHASPITRRFLQTTLIEMFLQQEREAETARSEVERDALVNAMVTYIAQRRTVRTSTRLVRTWSSARKRRTDDSRRE